MASPLGKLILRAMQLLDLSYQDVVLQSRRLAARHNNPSMRIGKSTLGNIISGSIRQPGGAKLDSLRMILRLSRADIDKALGLRPDLRLAEQLEMISPRTHEVALDEVTQQRMVTVPILRSDANLNETQIFDAVVQDWASIEVEYLAQFYGPHLLYVIIGEHDTYSSPVAPPGTRVLVNTFLTDFESTKNLSYHERALFYVLTPHGFTCSYVAKGAASNFVLIPHPLSGHVREEFSFAEVKVIGQVVGLLFPQSPDHESTDYADYTD